MAFCNKCGAQLEEGAQFCSNCGNVLAQSVNQVQNNYSNVDAVLGDMGKMVGGMFTKPVATVTMLSEKVSAPASLILGAILAVITALFTMLYKAGEGAKGPYGKLFLFGLLLSVIVVAGIFALSYLIGGIIIRGENKPIALLNVTVESSIILFSGVIIYLLFTRVNRTVGLCIFAFAAVITLICLYEGIIKVLNISEEKAMLTLAITVAIVVLVVFLIWNAAVKNMYLSAITDSVDMLNDLFK